MGGLIARYAVGALYNPVSGTVAGLTPCHFVSMATPHVGCEGEGLAQVRAAARRSWQPQAGRAGRVHSPEHACMQEEVW